MIKKYGLRTEFHWSGNVPRCMPSNLSSSSSVWNTDATTIIIIVYIEIYLRNIFNEENKAWISKINK